MLGWLQRSWWWWCNPMSFQLGFVLKLLHLTTQLEEDFPFPAEATMTPTCENAPRKCVKENRKIMRRGNMMGTHHNWSGIFIGISSLALLYIYMYRRCWTTWVGTSGRCGRILDPKSARGLGRAVIPGELNETDMFHDVLALSLQCAYIYI